MKTETSFCAFTLYRTLASSPAKIHEPPLPSGILERPSVRPKPRASSTGFASGAMICQGSSVRESGSSSVRRDDLVERGGSVGDGKGCGLRRSDDLAHSVRGR